MGVKSAHDRDQEAERLGLNQPCPAPAANVRRARRKQVFYAAYSDPEARDRSASATETIDSQLDEVVGLAETQERQVAALRTYAPEGGKAQKDKAEQWRKHARAKFQELRESGQSMSSIAKRIADWLLNEKKIAVAPETVRAYIRKL